MIEVLILSLIQGVTEFIPVSSSSHLILISHLLKFDEQSLAIDVSLHIGSLLAILFYFRKEIINFYQNKELFIKIFLSSIPVLIVGFLLVQTSLIDKIRNIQMIYLQEVIPAYNSAYFSYYNSRFKIHIRATILVHKSRFVALNDFKINSSLIYFKYYEVLKLAITLC